MFKALWNVALLTVLATGAWAQTPANEINAKINAGLYKEAAELLLATKPTKLDVAFFNGRVLKAQGKYPEAIKLFREVLRAHPRAANVRLELAHALLLNRQYAASEYQFRELSQLNHPPQAQRVYDSFLNKIAREKPMGISGSFAIVPSSNINRGTFNDTVVFHGEVGEISDQSRSKTGTGLNFGLNGYFRKPLSPRAMLRLDWQASTVQHTGREFDSYRTYAGLQYIRSAKKYRVSFGPYLSRSWSHLDEKSNVVDLEIGRKNKGLQFGYIRALNPKNRLHFNAQLEKQNQPLKPYLNGDFKWGQIGWQHQLTPKVSIALFGSLSNATKDDSAYDFHAYDGREIKVSAERAWQNGLITSVGLFGGDRGYRANYITGIGVPRNDTYRGVTFGLSHTKFQFKGASPKLSCKIESGRSNVEFFDYNVRECNIGLFRNF